MDEEKMDVFAADKFSPAESLLCDSCNISAADEEDEELPLFDSCLFRKCHLSALTRGFSPLG